ncbi:MAG: M48 family metallopeptidase [Clostridia bacterium]|nr:M48 family metallopeptidase [Clostridia bacterium]
MTKQKQTILEIDGIPVEIQRKKIKNLHLYVLPPDGRVRLSVPLGFTNEKAAAFVREKKDWILMTQKKLAEIPHRPEPQYTSGEMLYLFGRPYRLSVESGTGKPSVRSDGDTVILTAKPDSTAGQRQACLNEWYRGLLKEQITRFLPAWERKTGLFCDTWHIKNMKTRWGTCNPKARRVWLNLRLAEKPEECLEYVILHELAHLKIPGHGRDFEAFLDRYMPDWREIRSRLNERT